MGKWFVLSNVPFIYFVEQFCELVLIFCYFFDIRLNREGKSSNNLNNLKRSF